MQVRYVGAKPSETDCVAGTGITWVGYGDVKTVPAKAWAIMSKHPDVWELVSLDDGDALGLAQAVSKAPAPIAASPAPELTALVVCDETGRSADIALVDGVWWLPAGTVLADVKVESEAPAQGETATGDDAAVDGVGSPGQKPADGDETEDTDVDDIKKLRAEIRGLNGTYDRRWKEDRLRAELEALKAAPK